MKFRKLLLTLALCAMCVGQASALECVATNSISLAPPQAAGLAHSVVSPSPTKSYDFAGTLFDAPEDYLFGRPTSQDTPYTQEDPNVDRSKNVALIAPGFGTPTSYLPNSGEYLTPNLVPGALKVGLVNQVGSVNYPTLDTNTSSGSSITMTQIPGSPSNLVQGGTTVGFTDVTDDLYYNSGHLGTLKIPAIGLSVKVYEGTDSSTLAKGAGHFPDTSIWAGNICVAGHNRGVNNHFGQIHTLTPGDTITLTTKLGTRTYSVTSVEKVSETDTSGTAATSNNQITLYTCVQNQSAYRLKVVEVEQ